MSLAAEIQSGASPDYVAFLRAHADSVAVGDFVLLYGKSDIDERNATFEVQTYLPGWFALGDDGGGVALLMRLDGSPPVYRCGHGALGSLEPEPVAESFADWHASGCPVPWMDDEDLDVDDDE